MGADSPGYVHNLRADVFDEIVPSPRPYLEELQKIPIPTYLSAAFCRLSTD